VVERTARILVGTGVDLSARVTVTPASMRYQSEIVEYLGGGLGIRKLRLEPMYQGRTDRDDGFEPAQADEFVRYFLVARRVARRIGCHLQLSGVRTAEVHGPYCNVLRDTLQLTPDGTATACFLCTDGRNPCEAPMVLGRVDPESGEFVLDEERISTLRRMAATIPARCQQCVNIYHCARDCPDVCLTLGEETDATRQGGFRCRVQKLLGESWILAGESPAYSV
jgi:radical SAM protein with 4Fe4S-binding SPASM domain